MRKWLTKNTGVYVRVQGAGVQMYADDTCVYAYGQTATAAADQLTMHLKGNNLMA